MLRPSLLVSLPPEIRTNRRRTLIEHLRKHTRRRGCGLLCPQRRSAATTAAKRSKSTNSPGEFVPARRYIVGTDYFRTMGMSLARGRDFGPADAGGPPMMIVSQDFERRYLTGAALGRRVRINKEWMMVVVGVAPDTKLRRLAENDEPAFYLSLEQMPRLSATEIVILDEGRSRQAVPAIRQAVRDSGSGMAIVALETVDSMMQKTIANERYNAVLSTTFKCTRAVVSSDRTQRLASSARGRAAARDRRADGDWRKTVRHRPTDRI